MRQRQRRAAAGRGRTAARAGRFDQRAGIGLYQAARQAEASGYRLVLERNEDGEVCFALLAEQRDYGSTPAAISLP